MRIVTWNLECFNDRGDKTTGGNHLPDRTPDQLDALARRIIGFDASVIALQEIDQIAALEDLRNRMGGSWRLVTGALFFGLCPQQNALLYDSGKVELLSSAYVSRTASSYPEWTYRSPVTAVFSPKGQRGESFRVIGIHAHWRDATIRSQEGFWLSRYVHSLLSKPSETKQVLLMGDFNGPTPVDGQMPPAPHNGLVSGGDLSIVAKRNGDVTTALGSGKIDHIYVTPAAREHLTNPTSLVIRPEHYGEDGTVFRGTYSDHLPVFVDYRTILE